MDTTLDRDNTSTRAGCSGARPRARWAPDVAQRLSDDLSILAHPIRLQILGILTRQAGQVCVCDLEAALPVKQPTVSHHLRLLRAAGLIDCERKGQWAYYFINRNALRQLYGRVQGQLETLI